MKKATATFSIALLFVVATSFAELRHDFDLAYGESKAQQLDVWWDDAHRNAPIVLLFHGGGWISGDKKTYSDQFLAEFVTRQGCILVSTNYRLLDSPDKPTHLEVLQDAWSALAWTIQNAEKFQADGHRVLVGGSSTGSYLSSCLAYGNNRDWLAGTPYAGMEKIILASVRGWYGDSCMVDLSLPAKSKTESNIKAFGLIFNPIQELKKGAPMAYMSNGDNDTSTPRVAADAFSEKCRTLGIPCQLLILPGGHMFGTRILSSEYDQIAPKFKESMTEDKYKQLRELALNTLKMFITESLQPESDHATQAASANVRNTNIGTGRNGGIP